MKSFFIWMLVIQLATGHNFVVELLRLPTLIEHFSEHQHEQKDISFIDFLYLHYLNNEHRNADHKHENLPLHCDHNALSASILPNYNVFILPQMQTKEGNFMLKIGSKNDNLPLSYFLSDLFRPPQMG
jgi:hypothetical protein